MATRYFRNNTPSFHAVVNWSDVSGGAGGFSVPTVGDTAIFDANSANCGIISPVTIANMVMVGYTNIFTQNAATLAVTNLFTQSSGTFNGSASAISIQRLLKTGGTFRSTSGTLTLGVSGDSAIYAWDETGGIFNPNNGLVKMEGTLDSAMRNLADYPFYRLELNQSATNKNSGTVYVSNKFTSTNCSLSLSTMIVRLVGGDVVIVNGGVSLLLFEGGLNHSFTGVSLIRNIEINKTAGSVSFFSNVTFNGYWKHTLGGIIWNGFQAECKTNFNGSNEWTNAVFYDLKLSIESGVSIAQIGSNPNILNDLIIKNKKGALTYPQCYVKRNVSVQTSYGISSLTLNGVSKQNISGNEVNLTGSITINKISGEVNLLKSHTIVGAGNSLNLISGTFNQNNYNLIIADALNQTGGIHNQDSGTLEVNRFLVSIGVFNEGRYGIICNGTDFIISPSGTFNRHVFGGLYANKGQDVDLNINTNGFSLSKFLFSRATKSLTMLSNITVIGDFEKKSIIDTANIIGGGFEFIIGGDYKQLGVYSSRVLATSPTFKLNGIENQNIFSEDGKLDSGYWVILKSGGKVIQQSNIIIDNGVVGDNGLNTLILTTGAWCTNGFNLTVDGSITVTLPSLLEKTPTSSISSSMLTGIITPIDSCEPAIVQNYCNSNAIAGHLAQLFVCVPDDFGNPIFVRLGEMRNIKIDFSVSTTETTNQGQIDDGFKDYEAEYISWSGSCDGIYAKDDEVRKAIVSSILAKMRMFIKWTPDPEFNLRGDRRLCLIGQVVFNNYNTNHHVAEAAMLSVSFVGSGKPLQRLETEDMAESCSVCCEFLSQSIYMKRGESFQAPPAPQSSIGWVIKKDFYPEETGTGDIGLITLSTTDPSTGFPWAANIMDCPVNVNFNYLCYTSDYIPSPSDPTTEFVEIYNNSGSDSQLAIIGKIESAVGMRIGDTYNGVELDAENLFTIFNYDYLILFPDYLLDVSYLNLTDLSIVNTLSNLKRLKCDHNFLTSSKLSELTRPELTWLNCSYNSIGNDNIEMSQFSPTLKYLDISFNYLTESFLFSEYALGYTVSLDYLNLSNNFLALIRNKMAVIKEFICINNVFPRGAYWDTFLAHANSSLRISDDGNAMFDYSICEKINLSNTELTSETADPLTIANKILAQNTDVTTLPEAQARVLYNPKYSDITHVPYDPNNLPLYWIT